MLAFENTIISLIFHCFKVIKSRKSTSNRMFGLAKNEYLP
ncbi:hypothetical protein SAMN04487926_12243 [Paraburkholderia steynii]|uniref:Uncharacterized protein n=1 Tax=Paraburkholderia steynii TaxID=1245441 RepID=A0A7Z7BCA8_9BURK|nr:hypothetical protein SAMN04487926_12243 [Paraburkholderia steynii]